MNYYDRVNLLELNGFLYSLDHALWINREKKQMVSLEYLEERLDADLVAIVNSPVAAAFEFFFNEPPSAWVAQQLEQRV